MCKDVAHSFIYVSEILDLSYIFLYMSGKKYWDKKYAFSKKYFDQRRVKKKEQTGFRRNKNEQHKPQKEMSIIKRREN